MSSVLVPAYGIDVSNHNGMFNWHPWADSIRFAGIKCTEALDFVDPLYHQNMADTVRLGSEFYRFPYHYGHPDIDPTEQARFFVDNAWPAMKTTDHFALDLEYTGERSPVDVSFWAWTFCTEVNRLRPAHRCVVMTFPDFAEEGNCAKLGAWHLWVMDWGVPEPVMPVGPWREWALWQDSSGVVDRDRFNGDAATLRRFCSTTGPGWKP